MVVGAVFYQEEGGKCPVLDFLTSRPPQVQAAARARIQLLQDLGHILRRPYAENIGQDLYELRWHVGRVQYRILYFFHDRSTVVLAHALTKEARIPKTDLKRALHRKKLFEQDPIKHTRPGEPL